MARRIFKVVRDFLAIVGLLSLATVLLFSLVAIWVLAQVPGASEVRGCMTTKMFSVELCPEKKESYARLESISPLLIRAVIASEDASFYQHTGFDFQEIQNSFRKNIEERRFVRGGSTISQQLAKNLFLTQEKSLWRKGLEALITLQIERTLSKNEILERYLNVVQFGKDLFGVKKAAQFYFEKQPKNLDAFEAAYLAFLLPSPEKYSGSFFRGELTPFARRQVRTIVRRLYKSENLSIENYRQALARMDGIPGPGHKVGVEESESPAESEEVESDDGSGVDGETSDSSASAYTENINTKTAEKKPARRAFSLRAQRDTGRIQN